MKKAEAKLTYAKLVRQRYRLGEKMRKVGGLLTQLEADRVEREVAEEIIKKTRTRK